MYVLIDDSIGYADEYEVLGYTETLEDAENIALRIEIAKGLKHKPKIISNPKLLDNRDFEIPEYATVKVRRVTMADKSYAYKCQFDSIDCCGIIFTYNEVYYAFDTGTSIEVYIKEPTRYDDGDLIPAEDILESAKEKGIEILKDFKTLRALKKR